MKKDTSRNHGFTIIELVAVLIIVGILAAFTLPHFVGTSAFDARGAYDNLASALRYAQKEAIASNCPVKATITKREYNLKQQASPCGSGAFSQSVINPGTGGPFAASVADAITWSPATITFKATGETESGNTDITVTGAGRTRKLTVIGATGYVKTE
jgi:MSHA pilin protein MshC